MCIVLVLTIAGVEYASLGLPFLPWNLDAAFVASIFFYVGLLIRRYYRGLQPLLCGKYSIFVFLTSLIVNITTYLLNLRLSGEAFEMNTSSYGIAPLTITAAIFGSICVIIIAHYVKPKGLQYIGKNSLLYYAWHQQIFIPLIRGVLLLCVGRLSGVVIDLLITMLIVIAITILNRYIEQSRFRFIIGR